MAEKKLDETSIFIINKIKNNISPEIELDIEKYVDFLKQSLSLSVAEKKKVIDSTSILNQFQFDSLIGVFSEEREKFKDLMKRHPDNIKELLSKQQNGWKELGDVFLQEEREKISSGEDAKKIDDIKASLGL